MSHESLDRREFQKLLGAAFGGLMAGAVVGCGNDDAADDAGSAGANVAGKPPAGKHACRGLNECKGQGGDGKNDCAGKGSCATVKHSCGGSNECRFLGGCGSKPGDNECATKGGCHVPMTHGDAWDRARKAFEARMQAAGKTFGPPPAKPG